MYLGYSIKCMLCTIISTICATLTILNKKKIGYNCGGCQMGREISLILSGKKDEIPFEGSTVIAGTDTIV